MPPQSMRNSKQLKVQFAHGLEGSPTGNKATVLGAHYQVHTPAMNVLDVPSCIALHAEALQTFAPDVLVGSSFGGAIAVELLRSRVWAGPTLLLAQAAVGYDASARLPDAVHVWLVHGLADELIPPEDSRKLAATGSPPFVRLYEVEDDHALRKYVASGAMVDHITALHAAARCEPPTSV